MRIVPEDASALLSLLHAAPSSPFPNGTSVTVLRLDLLHPVVSGNKAYKLQPLIQKAQAERATGVASFGGNWSNHLHALAWSGRQAGLATFAFVRGFADQALTPMLRDCVDWGMQLRFLSREDYRRRHDPVYVQALAASLPPTLMWVPEGGSHPLAVAALEQLGQQISAWQCFDVVACALGTGASFAGLLRGLDATMQARGYPVLKADLASDVQRWLDDASPTAPWSLSCDSHGGGYGRIPAWMREFLLAHDALGLPLDPIYTGKAFAALLHDCESGVIAPGTRVLFVHTGGLQGRRGLFPADSTGQIG